MIKHYILIHLAFTFKQHTFNPLPTFHICNTNSVQQQLHFIRSAECRCFFTLMTHLTITDSTSDSLSIRSPTQPVPTVQSQKNAAYPIFPCQSQGTALPLHQPLHALACRQHVCPGTRRIMEKLVWHLRIKMGSTLLINLDPSAQRSHLYHVHRFCHGLLYWFYRGNTATFTFIYNSKN